MKIAAPIYAAIFCILFFGINGVCQDEPVRGETNLVSINVAVADAEGKPVSGLSRDQFKVLDNNVGQEIEQFSTQGAGVTFGNVNDMHPTTSERTAAVLDGLR